jgi:hypothetical protein
MRDVKVFVDGEMVLGFPQGSPLEVEVAYLEWWAGTQCKELGAWCDWVPGFRYHQPPVKVSLHHHCVGGNDGAGTLIGVKKKGEHLFEVYIMD